MPSQYSPEEQLQTTAIFLRALSLQEAGQEVDLKALCQGDEQLEREVQKQLRDLASIQQLLRTTTTDYHSDSEEPSTAELHGAPGAPPLPERLDRYEIKSFLGKGGFGQVWSAHDPNLERDVAIKIPRPDRHFSEAQLQDFLDDARKAASLGDHPHLVKIFDVQQRGPICYIVSDCIRGTNLATWMKAHKATVAEAVRIVSEVASALHHAHLRDLIHRDVKPANILLDETNKAYLTDFGLAVREADQVSEGGGMRGTVAYMSPEQARGESQRTNCQTDVYSLGVVLYELLTGRLPFVAESQEQYLEQIQFQPPRTIRSVNDAIPDAVEAVCMRCLAKKPEDRYSTAEEVSRRLREALEEPPPVMPTVPAPAPPAGASWGKVVVIGCGFLAVLVAVVFAQGIFPQRTTKDGDDKTEVGNPEPNPNLPINAHKPTPKRLQITPRDLLLNDPDWTVPTKHHGFTINNSRTEATLNAEGTTYVQLGSTNSLSYRISLEVFIDTDFIDYDTDKLKPLLGIFFGAEKVADSVKKTRYECQRVDLTFINEEPCIARELGLLTINKSAGNEFANWNRTSLNGTSEDQNVNKLNRGWYSFSIRITNPKGLELVNWKNMDNEFGEQLDELTEVSKRYLPGNYLGGFGFVARNCTLKLRSLEFQEFLK